MKTWHWLLIICAVGVVLRIAIPAHAVFANGVINFTGGPDSYWRAQNAREVLETGNYGFNYDTLLALMGQAAIIVPVLLAVGVIIMVYIIGRRMFGNLQGLIAASFIAVWPGEFFGRSLLACIDHHAFEVFLTTGAALIVILIVTQKRILTWWTLAGVVVIVALFFAYKGIWLVFHLPYFGQPLATNVATGETVPLGSSPNYIPQLDFALAVIGGFILIRRGDGWQRWLIVAWVVVMILATIYQVRFDYYLAVPLAVLAGFVIGRMVDKQSVRKPRKV